MFLAFSFACSLPTNQESFELISLLDNGHVFDVRFTKGDTGLLKGQGHLHINRWQPGTPMSYHMDIPPLVSDINEDGADFLGYRFFTENDVWQLYVRSEEYNVSGQVRSLDIAPIQFHDEAWTTNIIYPNSELLGWSSAMGRSGLLKGNAVLFHRHGEALLHGERHLLLAFSTDNYLGIEFSNRSQHSWGKVNNTSLQYDDITIHTHKSHISGTIGTKDFSFTPSATLGQEDLYDHLTTGERWISSPLLSTAQRHVMTGNITLENTTSLPAIYIYHGDSPIRSKRP